MEPDVIDQIYECSFVPESWPAALDHLAHVAEARGGHLVCVSSDRLRWTSSASLEQGMAVMAGGGWLTQGQRFQRLRARNHAGFTTDHDCFTDAELAEEPFYRDLLWQCGLGWGAGFVLPLPTGDTLLLSVERSRKRGPVEPEIVQQLDALRPHLARAALMSARLHLNRAQAASETLAMIGLSALVLDPHGVVLTANALMDALPDLVHWRAGGKIALKDAAANKIFQQALPALASDHEAMVRSFALRDAYCNAVGIAHLIPVRGSARDIFSRAVGVLVVTPVVAPAAPPVELVQSLFDLTPAEARVARRLAAGDTVAEIAANGAISHATVRTQVRGVLEKTGCRRQIEVVTMLSGLQLGGLQSAWPGSGEAGPVVAPPGAEHPARGVHSKQGSAV